MVGEVASNGQVASDPSAFNPGSTFRDFPFQFFFLSRVGSDLSVTSRTPHGPVKRGNSDGRTITLAIG